MGEWLIMRRKILFSTGAMRAYYKDEAKRIIHEQDINSKFGKVLLIDLKQVKRKCLL